MKFLIDNAISPTVAEELRKVSYDATHVKDYKMQSADDIEVFDLARKEGRILISADTDFGNMLVVGKENLPSLILFRRITKRRPEHQVSFLLSNLKQIEKYLIEGCIAVIEETRIRIRILKG